eukprot:CAMPEP_0195644246 /NCGR_PEP_ID=MMETSP0815-20121206/28275_1 /TAXON_ID=97485 /ORGANISM="Prymnesium parvum, Strain Texoma1" /LENGTH=83 /DNA_ID=CAMNT_0040787359 /DNA_START=464 /DNA_END=715 /DNA_ORIENTATION=+
MQTQGHGLGALPCDHCAHAFWVPPSPTQGFPLLHHASLHTGKNSALVPLVFQLMLERTHCLLRHLAREADLLQRVERSKVCRK